MPTEVTTRALAEKWCKVWTEQVKRQSGQASTWTLAQAKEMMLQARDYSPGHRANFDTYWKAIFTHFPATTPIHALTKGKVEQWLTVLRALPLKNSTRRHYFHALSRALEVAVAHEVIERNPCRSIKLADRLPDDTGRRTRRLTEEEFGRLYQSALHAHVRRFLLLAWATGARHREITGLEWRDLEPEASTVTFRHDPAKGKRIKNRKDRTVAIPSALMEAILREKRDGSVWVFEHADGRRMLDLKIGIRLTAKRAGLPGVSAHTIRHTVGSILTQTAGMTAARDHLGHSDFRMTSHYSHSGEDERRAIVEALGKVFEGQDAHTKTHTGEGISAILAGSEEVVSLLRRLVSVVERETGLEPATLSLEG
ncbi:MAG: site-specific integrase [Candidatus Omnitrophica bacterium]|nr:site-specific integrase [Candidatus Omnitrophota bacterium]